MRKVARILAVLAMLWVVYWLAGFTLIRQAAKGLIAEQVAAGTLAPGTQATAGGFPVDFSLSLLDLRGSAADGSGTWEASGIGLSLPAWAPWSAQAMLTGQFRYSDVLQKITLAGTGLETGIAASPQPSLPLASWHVAGEDITLGSTLGWKLEAGALRIDADRDAGDTGVYALVGEVLGLTPDPAFLARLALQSTLPPVLGDISLDAEIGLTAPLDRVALLRTPGVTRFTLKSLRAEWGVVVAEASGEVVAEASGLAEGRIMIRVANWRELLPVLRTVGVVTEAFAPTAERILAALAAESGDPAVLELPLTFAEGFMSLGPFPLGPAPLLR